MNQMSVWITFTCAKGFLFFINNIKKLVSVTISTLIDSVPNQRNHNGPVIFKLQYANDIIADFKLLLIPSYFYLLFFLFLLHFLLLLSRLAPTFCLLLLLTDLESPGL